MKASNVRPMNWAPTSATRHDDAVLGEDIAVDLHRQWFAVDQHAVAIEDDMLEHKDG